jgi:acyl carrier protein
MAMSEQDLQRRLRTVLGEVSRQDLSRTGPDDDLVRELGLDSLAALRLLAAVEKRFGVRFPDARLAEFHTLRQLGEFVARQGREGVSCESA